MTCSKITRINSRRAQRVSSSMDSLVSKLEKIVNEEVQKKFGAYLEHVANTYDISLKLLLRDLENFKPENPPDHLPAPGGPMDQCRGIKKNGKRCNHNGKFHGFCKWHMDQRRPDKSAASVERKTTLEKKVVPFENKLLIGI